MAMSRKHSGWPDGSYRKRVDVRRANRVGHAAWLFLGDVLTIIAFGLVLGLALRGLLWLSGML